MADGTVTSIASVATVSLSVLHFAALVPGCAPEVVNVDLVPAGLFGDGKRIVKVQGVLIPPQLNQTIETQEVDRDIELVYYLLRRYCTAFPVATVTSIIEPIRFKVSATQDLSLLTEDELTTVRTLNRLYNTDFDSIISVATHFPQSGLIT